MNLDGVRGRLRSRKVVAVLIGVLVLVAAITVIVIVKAKPSVHSRAQFITGTPEAGHAVQLDTTLYLPDTTPAPAVLLAHGFGGTKQSVAGEAHALAERGYVVLAYTARGFGASGGLIHLDAPDYEVHDASLLVTYLTHLPQVKRKDGKPQIAVAGSSYGGALALLLAGTDSRITAVGADITWNNLATALFPNAAGDQPGVFKKMWAGYLFQAGQGVFGSDVACGRFAPGLCAAYQRAASTGRPDAAILALLKASSPATVLGKITAPTLLTQGEQDSLFPLSQADANARGIAAHGTPVRVQWRSGGHDASADGGAEVTTALAGWLKSVFAGHVSRSQPFRIAEVGSAVSTSSGQSDVLTVHVAGYPGIDGNATKTRSVPIAGSKQTIAAPAGGSPAAITDIPVIGSLLSRAARLLGGLSAFSSVPGQVATFRAGQFSKRTLIAGASSVTLSITPRSTRDATLFVALHDVSPDGSDVLPSGLVAPLYLSGLTPGKATAVRVQLPSIVDNMPSGHHLELTVATTDLAYNLPADARTYTVGLVGDTATLTVPTASGSVSRGGAPIAWLITGIAVCVAIALAVAFVLVRRRRVLKSDPGLAEVPVSVAHLVKEYGDGYRAVNDISFRVERGQVVGLLGPNGAGKTTALRVLVGLITPTSGSIHVFGEPIRPGAPVLARVGAFIEGPGFLPHLSGRDNLRLYWAASGRPETEAEFETALEIAGLGTSIDRKVRTYSHGMRQRLGIAQAMLGLPELLVLDEPTNGLDPPQIAEMREVLQSYALTGRTVVVSSHLLAEVEQTCTHVVVMHRGQVVAAGSVAEVAGAGGMQLSVLDPDRAAQVLAAAGITAEQVPARRALEDVFLDLVGGEQK